MAEPVAGGANHASRRGFLAKTAATTAALAAPGRTTRAETAGGFHAGVDETLRIGLVGCGGRGMGAASDALKADPQAKLVAVGDAFADRAKRCLALIDDTVADRVQVPQDQVFSGFDAYQKVIDSGVDVVLLATPPHFRPQHFAYAVKQGKHCFVEKPVAVDASGVRQVMAACEAARAKRLAVVSGLCWRYDLGVRATMQQIEGGAIGDIVAIESNYNTGALWHRGDKPHWSRMEYQLRNWLYYTWLSGDHIVEQAIHSLDKTAWLLGDQHPVTAMGIGGRQQRVDPKYGHIFDHHVVFYEYPGGQQVYFTCRQQDGCSTRIEERVMGTKGQARVLAHKIRGESPWRYSGPKPNKYLAEQQELFKSIREGNPRDDGHHMVNSTMIAVMGRMASYSGKTLTWDEALTSDDRLGPQEYAWGDLPEPPVAIPGRA